MKFGQLLQTLLHWVEGFGLGTEGFEDSLVVD
jgi:hypothetical protein